MADDLQYDNHKRKYEEDTSPPPPPRRPTGFSAPIVAPESDAPPSQTAAYNHVPPPMDEFQLAKQKLQELASRAFNADAKRSKFDNGGYDQKPMASNIQVGGVMSNPVSHGFGGGSKKIEVPNGRVGVIIGKAGETIKYLQIQSGARIQITRDADHDPNLPNRTVELMGSQDQITKAEQLINEVLAEADTGGPGSASRRMPGASGSEQYALKVPSNKVGLVIGKGGETIKNIQTQSGARVQVIPLHPPPGDMSNERTVQIDGTSEQIEIAKQMVNDVIENRLRNSAVAGGYPQQGYQARPPMNWAPQQQQQQQPGGGYGYMQQQQQPGAYPGAPTQQPAYPGYPPQTTPGGGYPQNWEQQSSAPQSQQTAPQGTGGYDYYGQQQQPTSGTPTAVGNAAGYNYNQQYGQQGGYSQDGYGGYNAQTGYGQPPPQSGYDQQQQHGYAYAPTPPTASQEGQPPSSYGTQGEAGQVPQQQGGGYTGQPSPNPAAYPAAATQTAAGYGPGYGTPQTQRPPAYNQQPQQSPSQYAQPSPGGQQQGAGYPPPPQSGYGQPEAPRGAAAAAPGTYGGGAYPSAYGASPVTPPSYGQQPTAAYHHGGAYGAAAYPTDPNVAAAAPAPATAQPTGAAKASPQS